MSSINIIPVRPAFTNPVVPENNYSMLMSLNKSVYIIKAAQNSSKAEKLSLNEFGGMQASVSAICRGQGNVTSKSTD